MTLSLKLLMQVRIVSVYVLVCVFVLLLLQQGKRTEQCLTFKGLIVWTSRPHVLIVVIWKNKKVSMLNCLISNIFLTTHCFDCNIMVSYHVANTVKEGNALYQFVCRTIMHVSKGSAAQKGWMNIHLIWHWSFSHQSFNKGLLLLINSENRLWRLAMLNRNTFFFVFYLLRRMIHNYLFWCYICINMNESFHYASYFKPCLLSVIVHYGLCLVFLKGLKSYLFQCPLQCLFWRERPPDFRPLCTSLEF